MRRSSGGRVTRVDAIHLTLAFLGEVEEGRAPVLKSLRLKGKKHSLPIDAARYHKRNEMVWVGPSAVPKELLFLATELKKTLAENSFKTEDRPFAAHITLVRKARRPEALAPLPKVDWPVDEVVLVRSRLSPMGSRYEVVQRFPLS